MARSSIALRRAIDAANHLTDPAPPWGEVLACASELVGADTGTLIAFDSAGNLAQLTASGFSNACSADYNGYYHSLDVLEQNSRSVATGTWLDTTEMYSSAALQRTEFFTDFMHKHRMAQILALVLEAGPVFRAAIGFQRSTIDSGLKARQETEPNAEFFRTLRSQMLKRQYALSIGIQSVESVFSAWEEAALLLTAKGTVVRISPLATRYLAEDGGWIVRSGQLKHPDSHVQSIFESYCSATASDGQRRSLATRTNWGEVTTFDLGPAPDSFSLFGGKLVLGRMRRKDSFCEPNVEKLMVVFGLTQAEGAVLSYLVAGHSAAEIAVLRAASVLTVRKQIDGLMKKMQCSRQAELVRLASLL
ncbi:helix-turn-helix transcriptional regulator [Cupriavidus pauculus]|uniref:helix-turn-helix transcriptional regulator n=1 Tax=Cupriavidus pauculus TaxID=82633 RepID=UPI001EE292B5|nr:helix-turn-helix transcriptional regulator [Cupriavidus pauculus]GJG96656.1 helix-turn-helix transcriptional regulator [Cupriavidus pauculus]